MAKKREKWVVNQREMHLGFIKHTVKAGAVIEHDIAEGKLYIDGNMFDNVKDLDILKKQGWVDPFSPQRAQSLAKAAELDAAKREEDIVGKKPKQKPIPVVKSDVDEHPTIDISYTKKKKPEPTPKKAGEEMPVIRGDESPEERLARLQEEKRAVPMPVVQDDSLGMDDGQTSLNAGTVKTLSPEQHEQLRKEGQKKAKKGFTDERVVKQQKSEAKKKTAKKAMKKPAKKAEKSKEPAKETEKKTVSTKNPLPALDLEKL